MIRSSLFLFCVTGTPAVLAAQTPAVRTPVARDTGAASTMPPATGPLTLGDAIRLAARGNTQAQQAQLRAVEAEARVRQQRSVLFPNLTAVGSQGEHTLNSASFGISFPAAPGQPPLFPPNGTIIGPIKNIDYRGRVSQTLFDPGALARLHTAQVLAQSSHTEATAAEQQAGAAAATAYVRVLRAEDALRALGRDSALAAELVGIAQQQLQAGVGVALDVTRAQAQQAVTRAQLIAARNARDRARLDLLRALNLPLTTAITLRDSLEALSLAGLDTNEQEAVARALVSRPDLRAAAQRIVAARQGVAAIRAERLPTLGVVGDDGVNGVRYNRLLNTYSYAIQVSLPLFDGLRREGRIQEQEAQLREAELQERDLRDQATADVRAALLDLASASDQVAATREQLRLTDQEVSQARDRFRAGVAGNADVITALLSLTTARTALIDALTNYQNARIALARAQGMITSLP